MALLHLAYCEKIFYKSCNLYISPAINSQLCIFKILYSKTAQKIFIILYILPIAKNSRLQYYNIVLEGGKPETQKLNKNKK